MDALTDRIFSIRNEDEFNQCALEVFTFQYENTEVYRKYVDTLNRPKPAHFTEIPFLPIQFFKSHQILEKNKEAQVIFKSSGTGGERSKHYVADTSIYERSFLPTFQDFAGDLDDLIIFALLPSYVEQGESSLVYMVDKLIKETSNPLSGYYLNNVEELLQAIEEGRKSDRKMVLFGVSYALLDLAEFHPDLSDVTIIETGGMKGRRKEMSKTELHRLLNSGFGTKYISSEYGMCELLSQAYSDKDELFEFPNWMKFRLREVNDPFAYHHSENKTGIVSIIDLANIYSCSFIETQDLGRDYNGKLRLMGRLDHSEIRGCNLLVD
jgi:hypothetical protein